MNGMHLSKRDHPILPVSRCARLPRHRIRSEPFPFATYGQLQKLCVLEGNAASIHSIPGQQFTWCCGSTSPCHYWSLIKINTTYAHADNYLETVNQFCGENDLHAGAKSPLPGSRHACMLPKIHGSKNFTARFLLRVSR